MVLTLKKISKNFIYPGKVRASQQGINLGVLAKKTSSLKLRKTAADNEFLGRSFLRGNLPYHSISFSSRFINERTGINHHNICLFW
ncbi:hypothetical protein ES703_69437 [subsurface metagenome]